MPLLNTVQQNSGALMNDPRYNKAFNIAAQGQSYRNGLDKQLAGQKAKMYGGEAMALASPIVGAVNPVAGGAMFGAGNAMIHNAPMKDIARDAAVGGVAGKAGDVIMAKMPAMANQVMSRLAPQTNAISRSPEAQQAIRSAMETKFGNPYVGASVANPSGMVARNATEDIGQRIPYNQPQAITAGQVTNDFSNQAAGNTIIRNYPQNNQSLDDLIQASRGNLNSQPTPGQMMQQQVQQNVPQTTAGGVNPMSQVTNDFANTAPGNTVIAPTPQNMPNYGSLDDAVNGFMNDLNSSLNNQFGANSAPMGSPGALGNMINAENFGGGGMPSAEMMQQGLDSTRDMSQQFLNGGMGWQKGVNHGFN